MFRTLETLRVVIPRNDMDMQMAHARPSMHTHTHLPIPPPPILRAKPPPQLSSNQALQRLCRRSRGRQELCVLECDKRVLTGLDGVAREQKRVDSRLGVFVADRDERGGVGDDGRGGEGFGVCDVGAELVAGAAFGFFGGGDCRRHEGCDWGL